MKRGVTWLATGGLLALGCRSPSAAEVGADPGGKIRSVASIAVPLDDPGVAGAGTHNTQNSDSEILPAQRLLWSLPSEFGPLPVAIWVPERRVTQRFGVLITFHGRGESLKGPARGVRGWFDDYELLTAVERMKTPPLNASDFQNFVTPRRLREVNDQLLARPYQPMILVTPYLPDVLKKEQAFANGPKLTAFVADALIQLLRSELPVREQFGVDGVSLGGRAALLVGLSAPKLFRSVGTLQAAIDASELPYFAELAKQAFSANPKLSLRLLTSDEDYYAAVTQEFSAALLSRSVPHELRVVSGTHSYEFNRGPGAIEMLLHHQRLLGVADR